MRWRCPDFKLRPTTLCSVPCLYVLLTLRPNVLPVNPKFLVCLSSPERKTSTLRRRSENLSFPAVHFFLFSLSLSLSLSLSCIFLRVSSYVSSTLFSSKPIHESTPNKVLKSFKSTSSFAVFLKSHFCSL